MEENNTVPEQAEKNQQSSSKSTKMSPALLALLGVFSTLVVVLLIGIAVVVSKVHGVSQNPTILKVAKVLHLSAASVNGQKVLYSNYIEDFMTLKKFYAAQGSEFPPVSDNDISDMTVSRLVANKLIEQLSAKYNITVTDDDLNAKKQELLSKFPSQEAIDAELQKNYGWNFDTYLEKVIRPLVLEQKLQSAFVSSTDPAFANFKKEEVRARHILFTTEGKDDATVKKQAQSVLDRLKKGENFEKLAKEFGSDGTKEVGGDLGWFSRGEMVPEFETAAFALQKGQLGDLVKTQFGYHIVRLDDKREGKDFVGFMDDQIANAAIDLFINIHNPFLELKNKLNGVVSTSTQQ